VNIDPRLNFDAWFRDASATRKSTLLWQTAGDTESPYDYFKEHLDASSFVPSGHEAERSGNWEHFQSAEATRLLARFRATDDLALQRRIVGRLERLFLDNLPFVPLFAAPDWSTYSTRYFTGFPSARDNYVQPDFTLADYVVALTRIRPRR
jgi:peptide/nickel transport system substrate-binding protein